MWCIPEADAAYVACMEDVLDQYQQAYEAAARLVTTVSQMMDTVLNLV